jgi:hypothetical protein
MSEEINEKELPREGNSNARIYPPADKDTDQRQEEDPQQAPHGDAAAVRDDAPEPNE